jgi:hypothetical protein
MLQIFMLSAQFLYVKSIICRDTQLNVLIEIFCSIEREDVITESVVGKRILWTEFLERVG